MGDRVNIHAREKFSHLRGTNSVREFDMEYSVVRDLVSGAKTLRNAAACRIAIAFNAKAPRAWLY